MTVKHPLRVLTYNIHKGFNLAGSKFVLHGIRDSIELVHADLVFLQEVLGQHHGHAQRLGAQWPKQAQFEFLADRIWKHHAYGQNAVYTGGHHGNAILSKYPILKWDNIDISQNKLERRGLLHAVLDVDHAKHPVHVFSVHMNLFESDRSSQLNLICDRIASQVPTECQVILAGDFNDWRDRASPYLADRLGLSEVFKSTQGACAKSFPSWLPILKLDRIYFRGFSVHTSATLTEGIWSSLSDHAALYAELQF